MPIAARTDRRTRISPGTPGRAGNVGNSSDASNSSHSSNQRRVRTLAVPGGHLEYLVTGGGSPVTVFAHGLGGSIAETRPLGSGVVGTRVFFHFRGHGGSTTGLAAGSGAGSGTAPAGPWTYEDLAGELRAVADHTGATRALGVSLGASALLRLLAATPDRFERLVFFLPAALDQPRPGSPLTRYRAVVASGGVDRLADLAEQAPLTDRKPLTRVTAPALVVGQERDPLHPADVAADLAAALPAARLRVFGPSASPAIWLARRELREEISGFLNAQAV